MQRWIRAPLITCLSFVLCSCGDEPASSPAASGSGPARLANELIPLELKRYAREGASDKARGASSNRVSALQLRATGRATAADREAAKLRPDASWVSETLSERVAVQLSKIAALTKLPDSEAGSLLQEIVATDFSCAALRPKDLKLAFSDDSLRVSRSKQNGASEDAASHVHRGAAGFQQALASIKESFANGEVTLRFKVVGIDLEAKQPQFTTRVHAELSGLVLAGTRSQQWNANWTCTWRRSAESNAAPRLLGIRVDSFEEVSLAHGTKGRQALFADATAATLGANRDFARQEHRGIGFWSERITRMGDMSLSGHHGLAVGDVNGDGLEDLFVCDAGSLPNRLYVQNADGTASDVSAASQVDWLEDSRSALLVDLDGDGDQDLVVATIGVIAFAENDGQGKFTLRGGHRGAPYPFSISAADYDGDGDLDIYACVYAGGNEASGARGFESRAPLPYHDANNGGRNLLLENAGSFRFADVTDRVGLKHTRWSFAAAWEDFDRDGDVDLYVANDFGRNNLYRNDARDSDRPIFVDIAAESGVEDVAGGMSVAWGDTNRDGRADIYVGNMFSAAGHRVAYQRAFSTSRTADVTGQLQRMARGNSLFTATGDATKFADRSLEAGVSMGRWAWSSGFVDINNDGWEDIVVANGFMTNDRADDL